MNYEKGFEGLRCVVTTDIPLKEEKFGGWKFRSECGLETLHIDKDVIRNEVKPWHDIKTYHEITEWGNNQLTSAKDFVTYEKRRIQVRARRKSKASEMGLMAGTDTSFTLSCSKCRRSYGFDVRLESPLEPVPEMDELEAFDKLGFVDNDETRQILEKEALSRHLTNRDELLAEIERIQSDRREIPKFLDELSQVVNKYNMRGDLGKALIKSTLESLEELRKECKNNCEGDLTGILAGIAERCEELLRIPVEVP